MLKRAISGAVYVAVIILGILCGDISFCLLQLLIVMLAIPEFARLTGVVCNKLVLLDMVGALILVVGTASAVGSIFCGIPFIIVAYLAYLIARMCIQLTVTDDNALKSFALSMMSQLYIALPIALMGLIYYMGAPELLLCIFAMIWLNDTGAYIVGCNFGRHKMSPRISPKKSWEGFWGGALFAVVFGMCAGYFWSSLGYTPVVMGILGAVVALFATLGDLVESLIKRTLGVKDSGNLIPGHGGILDRIDSLLMVVPAAIIYMSIIYYI